MERFIASQTKTNEALDELVNQLNSKLEAMTTHQKMMENQIAQIEQQVSHPSRPQGHLPGQPETNPKGHINAITLRSGKELENPHMPMREDRREVDSKEDVEKEHSMETSSEKVHIEKSTEIPAERASPSVKPYNPPAPYP